MRPRHIVITGPMGTGKTALGSRLAQMQRRPFADSDEYISARYGRSGRELAIELGVPRLHAIERDALLTAVGNDTPAVIAAAASVADDPEFLSGVVSTIAHLVYLDANPDDLYRLAARGSHRRAIDESEARRLNNRRRHNAVTAGALLFPVIPDRSKPESAAALLALLDD